MVSNTSTSAPIIGPEIVGPLLVEPAFNAAVAGSVATRVTLPAGVPKYRIPVVAADPSAAWVAEGDEISPSDATLDEIEVSPAKLSALTIVTSELIEDSELDVVDEGSAPASVVGAGLARDMARKLDAAFFGNLAAPAPAGLGSLEDTSTIDAGSGITAVDPFIDAVAAASDVFAHLDAWVMSSADFVTLAKLKRSSTSNVPLLTDDPTVPSGRTLLGLPIYTTPALTAGTIYGIPRDRCFVIIKDSADIAVDRSVFFTSDRVAVRARMRVGFGFPHHTAIVKVTYTAS